MTDRLLPDIPAHHESLMLEKFALSRRAQSLIEHHDTVTAIGLDGTFIRTEIRRTVAAIRAIEAQLWEGDEQ